MIASEEGDDERNIIYEYSPWHSRLLIDYDSTVTKARFLKFTTQCHIIPYKEECLIEVKKFNKYERTTESGRSRLFIIVNHIIDSVTIPIYFLFLFLALAVTIKK